MTLHPSPDEKVYSVAKVAAVLDALAAEGLPTDEILRRLRLTKSATVSPATRISINQLLDCYGYAAAHSRDAHFPLRVGQQFHLSAYGMYGFAMLCSGHYRQTMDFAVRYHQLATPLGALQFGEQGGRAVWTFSPLPNPRVDAYLYRFIVDMQFAIMLTLHRDLMGPGFAASEFRATYRAPDDAAIYLDLFGAPFSFEHDRNELVFDAGWLDRTPSLANQISYATITALCDAQLDEFKLRLGLAGKVRQMLMMNLMQPFTFEQAAQGLNMSARTLRRRLHDEHTSFRELADQLRMTMAVRYLRDTDLTVEEIAAGLGFSDAANFRHAFRRWTRAAPRDFRGLSGRV